MAMYMEPLKFTCDNLGPPALIITEVLCMQELIMGRSPETPTVNGSDGLKPKVPHKRTSIEAINCHTSQKPSNHLQFLIKRKNCG
jgi:hypothetical protein